MSNSKESCRLLNVALSAHRGKHSSYIGEFLLNTTTVWERCFYFIFIFSKKQQSWIADSELDKTSPYFLGPKLKSSPQEKTPSLLLSGSTSRQLLTGSLFPQGVGDKLLQRQQSKQSGGREFYAVGSLTLKNTL